MNEQQTNQRRTPRIHRIAAGEEIILETLPPDVACLYEDFLDAKETAAKAQETYTADQTDENAKVYWLANLERENRRNAFWLKVNELTNGWQYQLGIRDGYAIVKMPSAGGLPNFLKELLS